MTTDYDKSLDQIDAPELPDYTNPDYVKFVEDMDAAGRAVYHYRGRFWYEGPAVDVDSYDKVQDVIRDTKVRVQTDNMGLGFVVYVKD